MPRPLRWSGATRMLSELRHGPCLAAALRRYGDPVHTMAYLNKQLRDAGAALRIRSRPVHVASRFGRVRDRLYTLERIET